jgi:hypothetical protein
VGWGGDLPAWRRAGGGGRRCATVPMEEAEQHRWCGGGPVEEAEWHQWCGGGPVEEGGRWRSPGGASGSRAAQQQECPVVRGREGKPAPGSILQPAWFPPLGGWWVAAPERASGGGGRRSGQAWWVVAA